MVELDERNRARWLWVLVAVTAAYALVNVIIFYTTDSFGPVWFASGILVYGILGVAAVALALTDTGRPEVEVPVAAEEAAAEPEPATEPEAPAAPEPRAAPSRGGFDLVDQETIYATRTGRVVRTIFRVNGTERTVLFAITRDEVLPVTAIEERLDEVELKPPRIEDLRSVEAALDRRAGRKEPPARDPETVPVEILDHETLYRTRSGRVLRVTYRIEDEERVSLFAVTADEVLPIAEVEGRLDALAIDELPVEAEDVFQRALDAREIPEPETDETPEEVLPR